MRNLERDRFVEVEVEEFDDVVEEVVVVVVVVVGDEVVDVVGVVT